jgi:hypothetical protein
MMDFKQTLYPFSQSFETYLNFEKVQHNITPVHPLPRGRRQRMTPATHCTVGVGLAATNAGPRGP